MPPNTASLSNFHPPTGYPSRLGSSKFFPLSAPHLMVSCYVPNISAKNGFPKIMISFDVPHSCRV
jgi:hypothetical protein